MGLESGLLDGLAIVVLAARVVQSLIHILLEQSDRVILIRFGFYFTQIVAMIAMAVSVLAAL